MKKRILSLLLALVMLLGMLPTVALAADDGWDGTTKTEPEKSGDVYQIGTAAELAWFRDEVNSGKSTLNATLTADIDLNNQEWKPIGNSTTHKGENWTPVTNLFSGTFDGNQHTISGLKIAAATGSEIGLFGLISGATIKNLIVKGAPIVKDNTANGKPSNLYICANSSSSPLLSISGDMTDGAQIGVSTDASCPVLLAGGMQTDYSAYFIPDDANTFVFYTDQALTLCAKPTATLEGDTLTITTGSGNTFVLLAAEYDTDSKMLAVHSWNVAPQEDTYTCDVKNPGAKIKCFLLRATSYTPVLPPFSPLA